MKSSSKSLLTTLAVISAVIGVISLAGGGGGGAVGLAILAFLAGIAYFIPAFIALEREHGNSTAIIALNLLLGWLLLPWIGAVIWALSRNRAVELIEEAAQHKETTTFGSKQAETAAERTCPFCAETVKAAAKICKHCHSELPPLPAAEPKPTATRGICPSCSTEIQLDSQSCAHCKADFGPYSSWAIKPL